MKQTNGVEEVWGVTSFNHRTLVHDYLAAQKYKDEIIYAVVVPFFDHNDVDVFQ